MAKVKVTITLLESGSFVEANVDYNSPGGINGAVNELLEELVKDEK